MNYSFSRTQPAAGYTAYSNPPVNWRCLSASAAPYRKYDLIQHPLGYDTRRPFQTHPYVPDSPETSGIPLVCIHRDLKLPEPLHQPRVPCSDYRPPKKELSKSDIEAMILGKPQLLSTPMKTHQTYYYPKQKKKGKKRPRSQFPSQGYSP
ncbi:hypothetical protein BLNAU_13162 [Blattamonas nauphoetae]|uniref:Uncharacterized protein n=1 Tax=Blattamonas nauphoetae TaxID=2049346 RepID=A0ABQ9XP69_9EUKA|nr:hypothetical protein BLNAU_13162 [Blattamonas nauphoetae]